MNDEPTEAEQLKTMVDEETETTGSETMETVETTESDVEATESDSVTDDIERDEGVPVEEERPSVVETVSTPSEPSDFSRNYETQAQRRGCIVLIFATLFGAILGTILTMGSLALLNNGNLFFMPNDGEMRRRLTQLQVAQETLVAEAATAETQSSTALEERSVFATRQAELEATVVAAEATVTVQLSDLMTRTAELDANIAQITVAAEAVNRFVAGLQGLLRDLDEETAVFPTPTVAATGTLTTTNSSLTATRTPSATATRFITPTATLRATATAVTVTVTVTLTPTVSLTPTASLTLTPSATPTSTPLPPTRTPRPTSTPLFVPTSEGRN